MQAMDGAKAQAGRSDRRAITDERDAAGRLTEWCTGSRMSMITERFIASTVSNIGSQRRAALVQPRAESCCPTAAVSYCHTTKSMPHESVSGAQLSTAWAQSTSG
jgi:hypothetical protein